MTIELYIQGLIGFQFTDAQLASVLVKRKVATNTDTNDLSERILDLCYADALMIAATTSSKGSSKDDMGNWSHQEGSATNNSNGWLSIAKEIYKKYNLTQAKDRTKTW